MMGTFLAVTPLMLGLIVGGGLIAGLMTGFLGVGGGVVLVPLFLVILPGLGGQPEFIMHQAVSTSLAVMIFSSLSAVIRQYSSGQLDVQLFLRWCPFVLLGVLAASTVFPLIPDFVLELVFFVYLLGCAAYMGIKAREHDEPSSPPRPISWPVTAAGGLFVGALSRLLGIGGGTFTVPYFKFFNHDIKTAIAVSAVTGLLISVSATAVDLVKFAGLDASSAKSPGYISFTLLVLITPLSMLAASLGVALNKRAPESLITWLYVFCLLAAAATIFVNLI